MKTLFETSLQQRFEVMALDPADHAKAGEITVSRGLTSGSVYAALHLVAARCQRLLTYNLAHFRRFGANDIEIPAP